MIPGALQEAPIAVLRNPAVVISGVIYCAITAGISLWAMRRTRTPNDFFAAGRTIGPVTLSIAAMAATLSGFTFIGGPGLFYSIGLGALLIFLPAGITNTLSAWVLGKRLRLLSEARGVVTIPEAIGARYRSPGAQGAAAVAILLALVGYMATNMLALGLIIDALFGTGLGIGIWIGAAVVMAYSAGGGILAGVYTDVFQGLVMAAASALVFLAALRVGGGVSSMSHTLLAMDPRFLSPFGHLTPLAGLSFFFVFGIGVLGQPHVLHKYYMLRDPLRLRWYPLIMTTAMIVTLLLLLGVGMVVKAQVANGAMPPLARPDDATPTFLLRYAGPWISGLVFAGVAAAIMSTVNSFMSVGAAAVTRDLPRAFGRRVANQLGAGRWATVLIGLGAAVLAQLSGTLVAFLGIFGWGLFASTLVPALGIGLCWEGGTRSGAIASILTGIVTTLAGESLRHFHAMTLPEGVTVSAASLTLSILVYFGVSWATPKERSLDPDVRLVMEA